MTVCWALRPLFTPLICGDLEMVFVCYKAYEDFDDVAH